MSRHEMGDLVQRAHHVQQLQQQQQLDDAEVSFL
eukprot:CAMPEP_0179454312 /NCGR_PEP_ID=MMETSP0799-20121207/38172_1 /TAXON_ID=46947 /ORGANISM="Geminigera cryophila, Strain CCMP2564" /LENGTH=33 /DNA_ID= /DNA_START= /DNA_END= /DNA_ORIENTATION=